jgi:diguanylate cyclase (GGDEF)-like protein
MSYEGLLIVAVVEAVCLLVLGIGALALVRRLRAGGEALWTLSRRDALTGVGNYRALHERLAEEISRHARRGREFALILIDLDGFKQVNEDLGHLEGDRLLAEIGAALREELRGEDAVFRQGGDEFAVIAPETNGEEAEDVAARIRHRVRRCSREELPISAGTGFAIFPGDGRCGEELLSCADADLLGSKRGRF